ncbi:hypothetical protein Mal48_42060 [Thalassoglobus polymorphus]|uniref:Uncharacterized protein n=1 Tax=Thalassoglobus polymorphus TaxID=2527994 RepID=A0A517QTH8_9PLAN|nr:hypothetical protein Mal48_42060 [Thalassoglobus polymorphus]
MLAAESNSTPVKPPVASESREAFRWAQIKKERLQREAIALLDDWIHLKRIKPSFLMSHKFAHSQIDEFPVT